MGIEWSVGSVGSVGECRESGMVYNVVYKGGE